MQRVTPHHGDERDGRDRSLHGVRAFSSVAQTITGIVITANTTTTHTVALTTAPAVMVTGTVRNSRGVNATVSLSNTSITPVTTNARIRRRFWHDKVCGKAHPIRSGCFQHDQGGVWYWFQGEEVVLELREATGCLLDG